MEYAYLSNIDYLVYKGGFEQTVSGIGKTFYPFHTIVTMDYDFKEKLTVNMIDKSKVVIKAKGSDEGRQLHTIYMVMCDLMGTKA